MNDLALWLSAINLFIIVIGGLIIHRYLPAYFVQKGKNLATKEDVEIITEKVEKIRTQHSTDIEKFKLELQKDLEAINRRRNIYDNAIKSLGIFILGRNATPAEKKQFLSDYSALWLWAPDEVLKAFKAFLSLQVEIASNPTSMDSMQNDLKKAYTKCVLEMRKTSGFPSTSLTHDDYKFVYF
ncbi:hypothetical protein JWJ90_21680 [Desulfobulbus rhabdoformis]|uniref:hypothetical protein n=1 Tax=Desulfobulbus rhabdoformis TaxID=34032 RepID=UPI001964F399|nr:hypothetical protein [Desulfobulbus rhabdoformis]MBM9616877.1 hypothetical protein [Desulfobulbus rhabdoformis]